ncbi:MAG: hypothetical protein A3K18_11805 [Lentisphaerae bacterium RIFOXYA12_64_32]|nr:MAG: hypothetical protein A3K18_11805 [Lentisphaerae bacterium RIFOXYA12_64_32]
MPKRTQDESKRRWATCQEALLRDDVAAVSRLLTRFPDLIDRRMGTTGRGRLHHLRITGGTMLHFACMYGMREITRLLIDHGCSLNLKDRLGVTPLNCAVMSRSLDIAKDLLAAGARCDIHSASGLGLLDTVKGLVEEDPSCVNSAGPLDEPPLTWAARSGKGEVARFLRRKGARCDLWTCAMLGWTRQVKESLHRNPDLLNAVSPDRYAPQTPLQCAVSQRQRGLAVELLRMGADTDIRVCGVAPSAEDAKWLSGVMKELQGFQAGSV